MEEEYKNVHVENLLCILKQLLLDYKTAEPTNKQKSISKTI